MAKTIIQTIGPLYGEVENGTVFGRPNGSVYVPPSNTISLKLIESFRYIRNQSETVISVCNSTGAINYSDPTARIVCVAQSQDSQNYIGLEIATDAEFTDVIGNVKFTAGQFNQLGRALFSDATITAGTSYYLRGILYSANGVPVSVSESITLEGYA